MEFSLHRQLKDEYVSGDAQCEVKLGRYRIDVVDQDRLIEIQSSSLSSIRDKIRQLLKSHDVLVVKPLISRKLIIKRDKKGGKELDRRYSPKRANLLSVFDELVYFTKVFPHRRLTLEVPLVTVEEIRYPSHGRRRRKRDSDFQVEDLRLVEIEDRVTLRTKRDLLDFLPIQSLPKTFDTQELAEALGVKRWVSQRVAYCLREIKAAKVVGKKGNAIQYQIVGRKSRAKKTADASQGDGSSMSRAG